MSDYYTKKTITIEIDFWENSCNAYIKVFKGKWFKKLIERNNVGPVNTISEALEEASLLIKNSEDNFDRRKVKK